jgi:tRNA (adenine37-N6)-methyltransferase
MGNSVQDRGYLFEPIGFVRSPFEERVQAPRQATVAPDVEGRIELLAGRGYDHALEGLGGWEFVWVLFVFHRNVEQRRGWKAKVQPPRGQGKQGVFATRSPHRPNPIGLTAARIVEVRDLVVKVRGLDLLDGTPVLDLKPYVAYADAFPTAGTGWLEVRDPVPPWEVRWTDLARAQIEWLAAHGVVLGPSIESALALGPVPRPYRRIRTLGDDAFELAVKDWRVDFLDVSTTTVADTRVAEPEGDLPNGRAARALVVTRVRSGHRRSALSRSSVAPVHVEFTELFHDVIR